MGNKIFNVAYANETKNIQPAIDSGDPNLGPGTLIMDEEAGELSFVGDGRVWHKGKPYTQEATNALTKEQKKLQII